MFRQWLENNSVESYEWFHPILRPGRDREFWASKYKRKYIDRAEKSIGYEWPLIKASDFIALRTKGSRSQQETPHFLRRCSLCSLVIGELLEYEGRFIPDIVDGIFLLCEETYWGVSDHKHPLHARYDIHDADKPYIDLFASETGALLSIAHYLLWDKINEYCPETLTRIEYEIQRRIIEPYLNNLDFIWMGRNRDWTVDNWNPWILSNVLTVFLLMEKDEEKLKRAIEKMLYEINCIYVSYPQDGGCDEGATYWGMSAGSLFEFCEQVYLATNGKLDFFQDDIIRECGKYGYRAYIGNGYFTNFADGSCTLKNELPMSYIMYMFGKRIDDLKLSCLPKELDLIPDSFADEFQPFRDSKLRRMIMDLIYEDDIKQQPDFEPEKVCFLKDIQNTFVHCGKWFYAAKGGHNAERHNHYDVGNFIVYYDGEPLFVDSGSGVYTAQTFSLRRYEIWTMQSLWHNLPVINGCGQTGEHEQPDGRLYRADKFSLNDHTTEISFADAYKKEAGLEKLQRNIHISEQGVILRDSFVCMNNKNCFCEHFITPQKVRIEDGKVIIAERFLLEADYKGTFICDSVNFEGDSLLVSRWNTPQMNRIKFSFIGEQETHVTFTLTLRVPHN